MVALIKSTSGRRFPGFTAMGKWVFLTATDTSWGIRAICLRMVVVLAVQALFFMSLRLCGSSICIVVWSSEVTLNISVLKFKKVCELNIRDR